MLNMADALIDGHIKAAAQLSHHVPLNGRDAHDRRTCHVVGVLRSYISIITVRLGMNERHSILTNEIE